MSLNSEQTTRISSYGRNRGRRLRAGRQSLVDTLLPELTINSATQDLSGYEEWWLEIGFGAGEHLCMQAKKYVDVGIIGCEPYINGLSKLLQVIFVDKLKNIRLFNGDARELMDSLPNACISKTFILFPDPWPKKKHHKRRLINHELFTLLARIMKPGGDLLIATDHEDYLTWILEHIQTQSYFEWTATQKSDWAEPPKDWVTTKYQAKALREGRVPHWICLRKSTPPAVL